jgi:hypothetical protein
MMRVARIAARWQTAELWCNLRCTTSRRYLAANVGSVCRARSAATNRAVRSPGSPALVGRAGAWLMPDSLVSGTSPVKARAAARLAKRCGSPNRPWMAGASTGPTPGAVWTIWSGSAFEVETLNPGVELVDLCLDSRDEPHFGFDVGGQLGEADPSHAVERYRLCGSAAELVDQHRPVLAAAGLGDDLHQRVLGVRSSLRGSA